MKASEPPRTPLRNAEVWPLSVAAYRALGEAGLIPKNTELLYGFVYKKMSKSPYHSYLVMRLARLLQAVLPAGCLLRTEQPITCVDSEPEPDLAVVRGTEANFLNDHPYTAELVIEVCVSSHDYDRSKLGAYASAGVKEVWLVLAPARQIEVHWQPAGGKFLECVVHGPGGRIACLSVPSFAVEPDSLFAK
jgi:Uma2 family endonuclease